MSVRMERVELEAGGTAAGQSRRGLKTTAAPWSSLDSLMASRHLAPSAGLSSSLAGRPCGGPTRRGCSCLLSCHQVVLSVTKVRMGGPCEWLVQVQDLLVMSAAPSVDHYFWGNAENITT